MLFLRNLQTFSIAGSGHCIIFISFFKIMGRATACAAGLFNLSPYAAGRCFNQLKSQGDAKLTNFGSEEKSSTEFISFVVFSLAVSPIESRAKQSHIY